MYNGNKRTIYYDISDSMLKLWYTLIFENQEKIKINGNLVFERNKEKLDSLGIVSNNNDIGLSNDMNNIFNKMEKIASQRKDKFVRSELFLQGAFEADNSFTDFLKSNGQRRC